MLLHWQNWKWIQQKGKTPIDAHKWALWISSCPSMLFPMTILAQDPILLHLQVWFENKSLLGTNSLAGLSFNYSVYDMKWIDSHDALCETFVFVLVGRKGYVNRSYLVQCGQWLDHGQCCWGCTHTALTGLSWSAPGTSSSEWGIHPCRPVSGCFRSTLVQDPAAIICKLYHSEGPI